MTNGEKLIKDCPFCGHKARHWLTGRVGVDRHIVRCNWCKIRTDEYATKESAIKVWNRRMEEVK